MWEPQEPQFKSRGFLSYARLTPGRRNGCTASWRRTSCPDRSSARAATTASFRVDGADLRDRDEARSAEHIERVIAEELSPAQHLIVLCTPNAIAPGSWVPREIALFRKGRPDGPIHAVIGGGTPPEVFRQQS